ncbi:calpain-2 catalytic subunit-like protein [Labeo rohita]|uniref:Calpain-2 catalytic subunit-like protein n=1 Tax=Labeo rohita TaxID=84645 RepID=A0A498M0Y2_LABRO|nr:calpain-2 catalytic subunit-like protein [Labeo rohita]
MLPHDGFHHHNPNEDDVNSPSNPLNFLDQDYQELHQNCLTENKLYNDELFPPDNSSIGLFDDLPDEVDLSQVVWKRPSFWRFGKWIDVVIDDQLPTLDDELLFVCSKTSNEFWPALLEKAYAKVCGSYADLNAGFISEALMDFTGGTHMYYALNTAPDNLWKIMECAFKSKTLMGCGSHTVTTPEEKELLHGIVEEHAYTVTGVYEMRSQSGRFSSEFFIDREPVAQTDELDWCREVMKFFRLEPGEYLIVPCTKNPGETASFVLSIFSKNETHFEGGNVDDFLPHPHYILMADCIYYEQSVEPLVETLKLLAGPETCIICCYEQRTVGVNPEIEKRFFELLLKEFQSEEIPSEKQDPEFNSPDIHILHLRRRLH